MKVLITGTHQGIGKSCAKIFLETGHEVIGIDKQESSIEHVNYTHYQVDIRDTLPEVNDVEILVNNAGSQLEEEAIDVNLNANIKVTEQYGLQPKIKSIVFITSASTRNGAEFPYYVASKGGITAYMKNVTSQIAKYGATCNGVAAGGVITPLNQHILDSEELYEEVLNETLLHKWATSEEIAELVYFLSVVNKSITGEDILIDNGEFIKSNFVW